MSKPGSFIISLDFELHWGVFDHTPLNERSRAYFDRTRHLIPPTLELFAREGIQATWATVGLLFAKDKDELTGLLPRHRPTYTNVQFDPYRLLDEVGENEDEDPYHYAPSLIARIADTPGQRIGSHTFGHYYCLEEGQDLSSFTDDLRAAQRATESAGYARTTSLVFPRNQYRPDYFPALHQNGFTIYRSNPDSWFWQTKSEGDTSLKQRATRLLDNYLPLSGNAVFGLTKQEDGGLYRVPASRFFRPYLAKFDGFGGQRLKLNRIKKEMDSAARSGNNYHLWWHPHNLATHPEKNMAALAEIIGQFKYLEKKYGWLSDSMESHIERHSALN